MKPISLILATALLFHNLTGIIYAATVLTAQEVTPEALTLDTFAEIAHRNLKGQPTTDRGYIKYIGSQTFLIRNGLYQQEIAYSDVMAIVMGKNSKEVDKIVRRINRDLEKREAQAKAQERALVRLQQRLIFPVNPVDTAQIRAGLYALTTYALDTDTITALGRIMDVGQRGMMIENGPTSWYAPYESIHSLFVAHRKQDIERFQKTGAIYQIRARITVPDISKKPIEGFIENVKSDTILFRSRHRREMMEVPLSSLVQLEVADGTKSQVAEGFLLGLGFSTAIMGVSIREASKDKSELSGLAILGGLSLSMVIMGACLLGGALNRTTIWVPVPLDRIEWREHRNLAPEGKADL